MNEKGKILLCGLTLLLISILYVKFEQKGNAESIWESLSGKVNAPEFEVAEAGLMWNALEFT